MAAKHPEILKERADFFFFSFCAKQCVCHKRHIATYAN